jgi:YfiH family protein
MTSQPVITESVYPVTFQTLLLYRVRVFEAYPQIVHGIFTRKGGVSTGPFHSLNLSTAVKDHSGAVERNIQSVCEALGVQPQQTVACHLVHGADILTVDRYNRQPLMAKADGLITVEPDIYLFLRFGDCTPLLFFDPVRNAVGLTHAGWRGTMQNAAGATVNAMVQRLGCRPQNIIAVIGPAIGPCCYEVGPEVMTAATETFEGPQGLFSRYSEQTQRAHFDMWAANQRQLAEAGVGQIVQSGLCTACRTDEFFSHRAEKGLTGRFGVIIGLAGSKA